MITEFEFLIPNFQSLGYKSLEFGGLEPGGLYPRGLKLESLVSDPSISNLRHGLEGSGLEIFLDFDLGWRTIEPFKC